MSLPSSVSVYVPATGRVCYEPVRAFGVYLTIDFALIKYADVSGISCGTCVHRHAEHWHVFRTLLTQLLFDLTHFWLGT